MKKTKNRKHQFTFKYLIGILLLAMTYFVKAEINESLPKNWDRHSQKVYQLLLAQLQNANDDYESSVETLVNFALEQKKDELYSKAFQSLIQLKQYDRALWLMEDWKKNGNIDLPMLHVFAMVMNGHLNQAEDAVLVFFKDKKKEINTIDIASINHKEVDFNFNFLLDILSDYWYEPNVMEYIDILYENFPKNKRLTILQINELRWQQKIDQAIEIVDKQLFLSPKENFWLKLKSDIYHNTVAVKNAENVWLTALKDDPNNKELKTYYADFLYDTYQWSKLQKLLEKTPSLIKEKSRLNLLYVLSFVYEKKHEKALKLANWESFNTQDEIDNQLSLVEAYVTMNQWLFAEKVLNQMTPKNQKNKLAKQQGLLLIDYFKNLKKGDERLATIQKEFFLTDSETVILKAQILEEIGDDENAQKVVDEFLTTYNNDNDVRYYRAILLGNFGHNQQAIKDLNYLYSAYPDEKEYQNALGYTLLSDDNEIKRAKKLIEKAIFIQPRSPHIVDSLGWLYVKQKEFEKSLPLLQFSYTYLPNAETLSHLIIALFYSNQQSKAIKLYRLENQNPRNKKIFKRVIGDIFDAL